MSEEKTLLVATKNAHKTVEIRAMLGENWKITDLTEHPEISAPLETGLTFHENAAMKALAAAKLFSGLVLADDSGLEVDALGGAPGVYSARFAGPKATDAKNRKKLLEEMEWFGSKSSPARFRCVLVLVKNGKVIADFDGVVEGKIVTKEAGTGGFGYDSLFIPEGHQQTFAELPETVKNSLSHRAKAMERLREFL
jgi:XTP/dITP diphosphohydrolase